MAVPQAIYKHRIPSAGSRDLDMKSAPEAQDDLVKNPKNTLW